MAAKKSVDMHDINILLERADIALKKAKKDRKKKVKLCTRCKEREAAYAGVCDPCRKQVAARRHEEKDGRRWISTNGHEYIYVDDKPVLYGRYRMEQMIGRPLQEFEMVIRIDGDKANNADHNLMLVAKPGFDLRTLICECGRHYFTGGTNGS